MKVKRIVLALLVFVLMLSLAACSGGSFKVESIDTVDAGFGGITGELDISNIVITGKCGLKSASVPAASAFKDCTVTGCSCEYVNAFAFNPEIASLTIELEASDGTAGHIVIEPGDSFDAEETDGGYVLIFPEE